jgi:hypothetical protein
MPAHDAGTYALRAVAAVYTAPPPFIASPVHRVYDASRLRADHPETNRLRAGAEYVMPTMR